MQCISLCWRGARLRLKGKSSICLMSTLGCEIARLHVPLLIVVLHTPKLLLSRFDYLNDLFPVHEMPDATGLARLS